MQGFITAFKMPDYFFAVLDETKITATKNSSHFGDKIFYGLK